MTRRETLIQLIRLLPEAINPAGGGLGDWIGQGPGPKTLTYGPLYHGNGRCTLPHGCACTTWNELQRTLNHLHEHWPSRYAHLSNRYWGGYTRRKPVRFSPTGIALKLQPHEEILIRGSRVDHSTAVLDCVIHAWPPWVDQELVEQALSYLDHHYRLEPYIPSEALEAAA